MSIQLGGVSSAFSTQLAQRSQSTQGASATSGARGNRPQGPDPQTMMQPVADLLGVSTTDLKSSLDSGQTLDQLAAAKGVSHDDLIAAIKAGLQDSTPQGVGSTTAASGTTATFDLDALAEDIASGVRPQGPQGPPPGPPPTGRNNNDQDALSAVSDLLDMTTDELVTSLTSGTSLRDLASAKGVSSDQLLDALSEGMVVDTRM